MKKVAIIGVGQLGSRHLQGLTHSDTSIAIELVEPYKEMQKIALERYEQMPHNPKISSITFHDDISELSEMLDLVIIATTANVRRVVLDTLLDSKRVKNIVLEKVLFQNYDDYDYFEKRFLELGINVWVNHPRRMFPFYEKFLPTLQESSEVSYHVQGGEWGMACNALHFLDHLQMLQVKKDTTINIDTSMLLESVVESKRQGCYEVYGTLNGYIGENTFSLTCTKDKVLPTTISIMSDRVRLFVDEGKGIAMYAYENNNWEWQDYEGKIIFYQSELTGKVVDQIILMGSCALPSYAEASTLHKPFIKQIQNKIELSLGREFGLCPIS